MENNLYNVINEYGESNEIKLDNLVTMNEYYFTLKLNKNIYKGKFKETCNRIQKRYLFENVEVYDGYKFQHYGGIFSTTNIDKIYSNISLHNVI
jgi:hypothetical protein